MLFRSPVHSPPNNQPQEPQQPRNHERPAPAPPKIDRQNQKRRHRSANRRPAIIESGRQSPLAFRKPLGNRLARPRPVRGLTRAQQKTKQRKAAKSVSQRSQHRNHGMPRNAVRQPASRSHSIHKPPANCLPNG